jgi:hypothetical protein
MEFEQLRKFAHSVGRTSVTALPMGAKRGRRRSSFQRNGPLFLIDTADGRIAGEVRLEGVPKAAQIARYAPDNSLLCVTSLNSDTVSLIDPSVWQQTVIKVAR